MTVSRQLSKIITAKVWKFFGGIRPQGHKNTSDSPIIELGIPSLITLPVDKHLGKNGEFLVKPGDYVKAGQPLTKPGPKHFVPLHASTSGYIASISDQILPHPSGYSGKCIVIKPDMKDIKADPQPLPNWKDLSPEILLERIRLFGVEGLGGAQFQTAAKLSSAIADGRICNVFIVNGCECEPVATCDDRLMQEKAAQIVEGIEIIKHILKPKITVIAIEDNKQKAVEAMTKAVIGHNHIQVRVIPTVYPSGAARNLIKIITGIEIPYDVHTSDCGIVVDNVETVYAVKEAVIDGIPLIGRVITVAGQSLQKRGNAYVRLGTSVRFVLNFFKLNPERRQRIILGGPFMGFTLPSIDVPVTKSTTCIFTPTTREMPPCGPTQNCIRCGRCARVCPSRLTPYKMYALSKASKHPEAQKCGILDCTECGCCSFVCPSRIPLSLQFKREKTIVRMINDNKARTKRAQERMAARTERLKAEALAREEKKKAALERISAMKNSAGTNADDFAAKRAAAVAAARARAEEKRARAASGSTNTLLKDEIKIPSPAAASAENIRPDAQLSAGSSNPKSPDMPRKNEAAALLRSSPGIIVDKCPDVPYNLRRGAVAKKALLSLRWEAPLQNTAAVPLKVENPPEDLAAVTIAANIDPKKTLDHLAPPQPPRLPDTLKLRSRS